MQNIIDQVSIVTIGCTIDSFQYPDFIPQVTHAACPGSHFCPRQLTEKVPSLCDVIFRQCLSGVALISFFCSVAAAQNLDSTATKKQTYQRRTLTDCVTQGAAYHRVNPWVIRAILKIESNFNAAAVNTNKNGTLDLGMAQINSIHFNELGRYGVTPQHLMNACVSSYVAAWHLKKQIQAHGNTWFAVGAYHSTTSCNNKRYAALVWNTLLEWRVVEGKKSVVPTVSDCRAHSARVSARDPIPSSNISPMLVESIAPTGPMELPEK